MPELTDQEIVAACARAVDAVFERNVEVSGGRRQDFVVLNGARMEEYWYNPLTDRAQAMELVEKLGMSIEFDDEMKTWFASQWSDSNVCIEDANLLRAVCLCAARVQIEKERNANG